MKEVKIYLFADNILLCISYCKRSIRKLLQFQQSSWMQNYHSLSFSLSLSLSHIHTHHTQKIIYKITIKFMSWEYNPIKLSQSFNTYKPKIWFLLIYQVIKHWSVLVLMKITLLNSVLEYKLNLRIKYKALFPELPKVKNHSYKQQSSSLTTLIPRIRDFYSHIK